MHSTFLTHFATFFNIPISDKQYKLRNSTLCIVSSNFLCLYSKHYSRHSVLKQNQLINGKKHSPFLKALLYVIHIMHPYFNQQNGLITSNKTDHKPHFILHTKYYTFQHQGAIFQGFIKNKGSYVQHVLQVPVASNYIIRFTNHKLLKF